MGGSQLAQLKQKLHSAGVSDRRQQSKKTKKRNGGQDEIEAAASRRKRIETITKSFNPFEEKVTKPKHEVLGRKVKGAVGRPGAAKASGLAQRRATLLPEWQARNKSSTFIDRRFGENDANLTPEEKMLERFAAEKQRRAAKGAMFSLNDEDDVLTHYGQSLSGFDDLADTGLRDDDDEQDKGQLNGAGHFGGFGDDDDDPDRKKTKAEVMREVMAKSKFHKLERQKIKDQDDELRHQLDDELGDIRDLLYAQAPPPPPDMEEGVSTDPSSKDKSESDEQDQDQGLAKPLITPKVASNTYDAFVRELAFEKRAKPQDRLKSETELAAEEAKLLMTAENARLKRMRGESGSEDEEDQDSRGKRRKKGTKSRPVQGDDLEDDFDLDGMTASAAYGLGSGLGVEGENNESEEDDDEDDAEDDKDQVEDGDADEDNDDFADLADVDGLVQPGEEEDSEQEGEHEALTGGSASKAQASTSKSKSKHPKTEKEPSKLPFTFPCPSSHEELLAIVSEHEIEAKHIPTVVKRIRTLYHPSLHEDNKYKLQAFLGVLIDHSLHWASLASHQGKQEKYCFAVVNALLPHIFSLSQSYPLAASQHFVSKLALMQRNLSRGLQNDPLNPDAKTWPGLPELTLLRSAGTVWPTSDRQHAVTTPLALLIAQYLAHPRIRSLSDLASGLFLSSLVISNEQDSKRISPEALNFLFNCVAVLAPLGENGEKEIKKTAEAFGIPTPDDVGASHVSSLRCQPWNKLAASISVDESVDLLALLKEDQNTAATKVQLFGLALRLIGEMLKLYNGSTAYVEMFSPFLQLLRSVDHDCLASEFNSLTKQTENNIERQVRMAALSRRSLRLQAHRAIPIASFVPKFEQQGFNPDRKGSLDPDSERVQLSKMKALIKKERKGAIRELRRDNQFLAEERRKEQEIEDQSYKKKIDKIMSTLQDERSEEKQMERLKVKLKKRAGKK